MLRVISCLRVDLHTFKPTATPLRTLPTGDWTGQDLRLGLFHLVFFIAGLLFYCATSASIMGSVSHPAGDRPSHLICPFRAFGPRNLMKVVFVTALFSARGP